MSEETFEALLVEASELWPKRTDLNPRTSREDATLRVFCGLLDESNFAMRAHIQSEMSELVRLLHTDPAPNSPLKNNFRKFWNVVADSIHTTAVAKGWWPEDRNDGENIALIHSELSEALEAMRHGNPTSESIPEFSAVEEELADAVIRLMDLAVARGWDVAGAIQAKCEFNKSREHRHGKDF